MSDENQEDNFNIDLEMLLKDLEETDTNEVQNLILKERFRNVQKIDEKRKRVDAGNEKDKDRAYLLQRSLHEQQMSIDTKTVSDLLKELDLVDKTFENENENGYYLNPFQSNGNNQNGINNENSDNHIVISNHNSNITFNQNGNYNNISSSRSQLFGSNFDKDNSIIKLSKEQHNQLYKDFQAHQLQHQLLQEHFLNNSIIQNSIIAYNPQASLNQQYNSNNSNNNINPHNNNNRNNSNNNNNANNQTNFDDIDNFLNQLDENDTVIYNNNNNTNNTNVLNSTDILK